MQEDLADEGETVTLNRAARLIAAMAWRVGRALSTVVSEASRTPLFYVRNWLVRDFIEFELETKWAAKITEINNNKYNIYKYNYYTNR